MELGTFIHMELQPIGDTNSTWWDVAIDGDNILAISNCKNGGYGRAYISNDYGENWEMINERAIGYMLEWEWQFCVVSEKYMAMTSNNSWLFVSDDYGATWSSNYCGTGGITHPGRIDSGGSGGVYEEQKMDMDGENIIMGMQSTQITLFDAAPAYLSKDAGRTWQDVNPIDGYRLKTGTSACAIDGNNIIVCQSKTVGVGETVRKVFLSKNLGESWEELTEFPTEFVRDIDIKGNNILAVLMDKIVYSKDLGESWEEATPAEEGMDYKYCGVSDVAWFFATESEAEGKLYTSIDLGETWQEQKPGGDYNWNWKYGEINNEYIINCVYPGRIYLSRLLLPKLTTLSAKRSKVYARTILRGEIEEG